VSALARATNTSPHEHEAEPREQILTATVAGDIGQDAHFSWAHSPIGPRSLAHAPSQAPRGEHISCYSKRKRGRITCFLGKALTAVEVRPSAFPAKVIGHVVSSPLCKHHFLFDRWRPTNGQPWKLGCEPPEVLPCVGAISS